MSREKQKVQPWILVGLMLMSVLYSAAAGYAALTGNTLSYRTALLWAVIFAVLIALWAKNDARLRSEQKPFEYSYFVFLFWPVVLPYHLIKSRGLEGLVLFLGICLMYWLPDIVAITTWTYLGK